MDLESFWQENKRFLLMVGGGLLVFLIAYLVIEGMYEDELVANQRSLRSSQNALAAPFYSRADLEVAEEQNEELRAALVTLKGAIEFEPREAFQLAPGMTAYNQYFRQVERVDGELSTLANRSRVIIPPGLDLEMIDSTQPDLIQRWLEAVDLIERVVRLAIESGVDRVDRIQVKLDPALQGRGTVDEIESTKVTFDMRSEPEPVARLLSLSQSVEGGGPLPLADLDVVGASAKREEIRVKVTFLIARVSLDALDGEDGDGYLSTSVPSPSEGRTAALARRSGR